MAAATSSTAAPNGVAMPHFYAENAEVVIRHVTMQPLLHENN